MEIWLRSRRLTLPGLSAAVKVESQFLPHFPVFIGFEFTLISTVGTELLLATGLSHSAFDLLSRMMSRTVNPRITALNPLVHEKRKMPPVPEAEIQFPKLIFCLFKTSSCF